MSGKRHFIPAVQSMGNACPPLFTTISMTPLCSQGLQGRFNLWVLQYLLGIIWVSLDIAILCACSSHARCWGSGDVIYGYCLWRGGHDPQPSWVHVSSTIPPVTPANYNLHLALSSTSWIQVERLRPERGFGSKKPSCLFHPAAGLMGSEGLRRLERLISHH